MRNGATPPRGGEHRGGDPSPVVEQGIGRAVLLDDEFGEERFAAPEQYAGHALHDPLGREIGRVEKLFLNGKGGVEYVEVKIGPFWRKRTRLIPVESVSVDCGRQALVLG